MSTFAKRSIDPKVRDAQNRRQARLAREVRLLDPKRAHDLARSILEDVLEDGMSYADFESAQTAKRHTRRAVNALRGIS